MNKIYHTSIKSYVIYNYNLNIFLPIDDLQMKKSSPNILNYLLLPNALERADMKLETDLTGFVGRNMLFILLKH